MTKGWIGVDLDGTLAFYEGFRGDEHIGEPITPMLERVKRRIKAGATVCIFTARAGNGEDAVKHVKDWCMKHGLGDLRVTNVKDRFCTEIWDDRAFSVEKNTGRWVNANFADGRGDQKLIPLND